MEKEFLKNQEQLTKEGYIIIPNYFLREWVKVLGVGPALLYLQLLSYCHKEKDLAWPTLDTLSKKMQFTPKSITKFHQILLKHGLIKKVSKGKTPTGNYNRNIYQVTPLHMVKNTLSTGKIFPYVEEKITPNIGKKLPTNNTNLNNTNLTTTTKREKDAVVAVVNFKKLKEKGEEKMQVIRERMVELDFKEEFIERILKDYPAKKIEEKLDLLMERKNIQSPAGWLSAALKNDYRGEERESQPTPHPHLNPPPSSGKTVSSIEYRVYSEEKIKKELNSRVRNDIDTPEWTSTEKAIKAIKLIQNNLSARISPLPSRKNIRVRENSYPLSPGGRGSG